MSAPSTDRLQACPICGSAMEMREVAPCMDCGADAGELEDWARGEHTYSEFLVMGLPLTLCDFCDADFPSYRPEFLGIGRIIDYDAIKEVRALPEAAPVQDYVCPSCDKRLAFLDFLVQLRARHAA